MIEHTLRKAISGARLAPSEGQELLGCHDLIALGKAADAVSRRRHPEPYRTYNIDRNINYTNICSAVCDFCAFYRDPKSDAGYVLPREVLLDKVRETVELGGNQILLQGGLHPTLPLSWYEELLHDIKQHFPQVHVHGFSPPEIHHFTKISKLPLRVVLERLRDAGLGSIPGGGAEILVDRVRRQITRGKVLSDDWLNVMRLWHELGGCSSATMMFGHVETLAERIEHLERLRQLQDETGGFTAFICWTFQPDNTALHDIPRTSPVEYLRTQAVARLYLDNFANIQASWVTQGWKIGQLAMLFGANDMGSLMIEENVVAEAGTIHYLTLDQIRNAITELGFIPRQRNVRYELVGLEQEERAVAANRRRDRNGMSVQREGRFREESLGPYLSRRGQLAVVVAARVRPSSGPGTGRFTVCNRYDRTSTSPDLWGDISRNKLSCVRRLTAGDLLVGRRSRAEAAIWAWGGRQPDDSRGTADQVVLGSAPR